ncbi:MAG: DUF1697 domain-containing protein [Chloroflexi bacterium]|nr:DUF1697 domain-containing protein [Chloroflexota bacterium]
MPIAISFLRGINVGGHKKIKMAELRELYESLDFQEPRSLLQSGNVVFATAETDLTLVGARIEAGIHERFGFDVQAILRSPAAFRAALARHPFTAEQLERGNHAMIAFLSAAPDPASVEALRENNPGREVIHAAGDALYVFYSDGVARSKLDNKRIERTLNMVASARNWNTCQRLLKLLGEVEA